jgi:tetratricopeptide (TPR) repeat protein
MNLLSRKASPIRLLLLLAVLLPLSWFAWQRNQFNSALSNAQRLILNQENFWAIESLRKTEQRFGLHPETSLLMARANRYLGKSDEFRRSLDHAIDAGLPAKRAQQEELLYKAQRGELPDVVLQMSKLMQESEDQFEAASIALSYGLLVRNDYAGINDVLMLWQSHDPKSPWIPLFRGMILLSRREWKGARDLLEPARESNPSFVPFYANLGTAYLGLNESEKAVRVLERYLESLPDDADASLKLASALRQTGRSQEALQVLMRVVPKGEPPHDILLEIAKINVENGESQQAIDRLAGIARSWPEDVPVATVLSQAYQQLGDEEKATLYATFADQGQKELTSADEKLFALLSQPQRSAKACYELGHILLHKQSRLHGVYWLEAALKIDEGFIPAHQDMITFYTRTNQPQLAAVHQRYIDRLTSTDRPNNTGGKNGSGASDLGTTQNPTGSSQP